jgi:hypothetical protein
MKWKKEPRIKNGELHIGCLNCSTAMYDADMRLHLAVGFGESGLYRDGELFFDGEVLDITVGDCEIVASKDPSHDWRIVRYGPLHGETFQRHGKGKWVCIESNQGFA